ncbi:unnamed protein product [Vitrella brassicaformis CCMP3155]|uniref:Uncharacterized protein n=1 Tax=Vitrella brassicaformis (strain CCMP3155) TaxID=1169540 RepID=A0A0G4F0X0_VITBC|nr:unnamed protein product [Vitrella brassicaformis CCMP3155]|mmetsp:Transcript_35667/g.88750  ORF Transcript_35667/g.88750 Transcript_35667/m.88750 type:complete len:132 (-) Transcript_35667:572-967(-)|eukprot:CEM05271.1 unnamed protein product [Vitrella brassicaformis CCMP3155]
MLPYWLLGFFLFIVGLVIPILITLHHLQLKDYGASRVWLFYLVLVAVGSFVLIFLEPILRGIIGILPLDLYYELKLALVSILVVPRTGMLEKLLKTTEDDYDKYIKVGLENCRKMVKKIKDSGKELLNKMK